MTTTTEKRIIGKYVRANYSNPHRVRFDADGSVTVSVDPMPNTNRAGRIFAGWAPDLLRAAKREASL